MRIFLGLAIFAGYAALANAQLRSIPEDARRGEMRHLQEMVVELDGAQQRLAPGAQIRDGANRVILPSALTAPAVVKYLLDDQGLVRQVWILTPQEAARAGRGR